MRAINDYSYAEWLLNMGNGTLPGVVGMVPGTIEIPQSMLLKKGDNLIDTVFGDNFTNNCTNDYTKKAILCPTNEACAIINEQISGKIKVKLQNYYSIDSIDSNDIEEITNFPIEFLNSINISGLPPHKLSIKVGAVLMLIRNMNKNLGK